MIKQYHKIIDQFTENLKSSLKISCFTEDNNSLLMWAKYADDHKGFSIEYDFKSLDPLDIRQRLLSPVKYINELFDVTSIMQDKSGLAGSMAHLVALYKHSNWDIQKEWRIVIPGGLVMEDSNYPVPQPTGLYLGKNISKSDEDVLLNMARYKKVSIYKMSLSYESYDLIPVLIQ
jgi:hypothetical protein